MKEWLHLASTLDISVFKCKVGIITLLALVALHIK